MWICVYPEKNGLVDLFPISVSYGIYYSGVIDVFWKILRTIKYVTDNIATHDIIATTAALNGSRKKLSIDDCEFRYADSFETGTSVFVDSCISAVENTSVCVFSAAVLGVLEDIEARDICHVDESAVKWYKVSSILFVWGSVFK